ncbi:hypothetical protein H072_4063 [Dactylellina haptotyla CBS 200.50]|uniref:BSD domain-containing protein n=1 Tax=Dactylellina haptotyla (strain CBS 200.50) TaxID=1284197 RepID=S8BRC7_DACHA|nr:hypothetical protein H072_4063 [Dactylellina haptotyla CBS 200.50]
MDFAYDHITEENLPRHQSSNADDERAQTPTQASTHRRQQSLSSEFDEAYKTIQSTAWGARFGAIFETVKKQSEVVYESTRTEYASRSEQAQKGWTGLRDAVVTRSRALSTGNGPEGIPGGEEEGESSATGEKAGEKAGEASAQNTASLIERLRLEAMKGITEVQKAEDAADAYLAKVGANLGSFLRDAVTIAPPTEEEKAAAKAAEMKDVLFETKGGDDSKRPIHTTRLDAQLHLLHSNLDTFKSDPRQPKYATEWVPSFSAEKRTDQISKDLEQYPELRNSMEKLVPAEVTYEEFWKRYYFLRGELDAEEQKRKELLKVAAKEEEEVGWEEDSDEEDDEEDDEDDEEEESEEEEEEEEVEKPTTTAGKAIPKPKPSSDTLRGKPKPPADIMSQPDSEASYDLVSGAPSNASGSPPKKKTVQEESDEEDWE